MRAAWGHLLILAAAFLFGWSAHSWHNAQTELAANQSADETRRVVTEVTRQSGEALEAKIAELKANEIHTERETRTEVIKPVFSNVCASDEYVRLFNQSVDKAERTLSGKPASAVPGHAASPFRADRH